MSSETQDKQAALDGRYIRMAKIWAENSYCKRRQVGALLVKNNTIISDGYNGTPAGFKNVCEDEDGHTLPYVLHAEANAITKIARSGNSSEGATLYVTTSPCIECSKLIIQAGIARVVFSEYYRLSDGIDLLREAGIKVYLGQLGNHDCAGLCQLSKTGAKYYAQILADAVKRYKLDGVSFDDEYSSSPISSEYLTSPSPEAGARLLYETKLAMKEIVPWDTDVQVYQLGNFDTRISSVDGHRPGEFVDIVVGDYGRAGVPLNGMTKASCSVMSVELNLDRGDISAAYRAEAEGYGWMMYFSFDPVKKLSGGVNAFTVGAQGLWGMKLLEPTGIYKKKESGEKGAFDPVRYEL